MSLRRRIKHKPSVSKAAATYKKNVALMIVVTIIQSFFLHEINAQKSTPANFQGRQACTRENALHGRVDEGPPKSYRGHKIWRLTPRTPAHQKLLQDLGYDFWLEPNTLGQPSEVMVSPEKSLEFMKKIKKADLPAQVIVTDVQDLIDAEGPPSTRRFDLYNYNEWFLIYKFYSAQARRHPDKAQVIDYGYSHECRPLRALRISKSLSAAGRKKPIIFIEAGIHGREWISPAVGLYLANELLNGKNKRIRRWLNDFDVYIVTTVNVDGYAYSFSKDRLWRKTRTPNPEKPACVGTDPNRNWDFEWGVGNSSPDPCDFNRYRGPRPLSEPSIRYLTKLLDTIGCRLAFYYSIHSYNQVLLIPYAYSAEQFPFYEEELAIAEKVCDAMRVRRNTTYEAGTVNQTLGFVVGGSSFDWVKNRYQKALVHEIVLPPGRGTGDAGFILHRKHIKPISLEVLDGLQVYVDHLRSRIQEK